MNIRTSALPVVLLAVCAFGVRAQVAVPRISQNQTVTQTIGVTDVTVKYSRPGVKGREIWGGLVPYDKVWRTGANEATNFRATDDITVEGHPLPAGSYSLATIPGKRTWTVIFNTRDDLWGTNGYSSADDVLRVTVTPVPAPFEEWMRIGFEDLAEDGATLVIRWEKLAVPVKLAVDTRARVLAKAKAAISWQPASTAAQYCLQHDTNLDDAMKWIDVSMAIEKNYSNTRIKAQLLEKRGEKSSAISLLEQAIAMGEKLPSAPFDLDAMKKLLADWQK